MDPFQTLTFDSFYDIVSLFDEVTAVIMSLVSKQFLEMFLEYSKRRRAPPIVVNGVFRFTYHEIPPEEDPMRLFSMSFMNNCAKVGYLNVLKWALEHRRLSVEDFLALLKEASKVGNTETVLHFLATSDVTEYYAEYAEAFQTEFSRECVKSMALSGQLDALKRMSVILGGDFVRGCGLETPKLVTSGHHEVLLWWLGEDGVRNLRAADFPATELAKTGTIPILHLALLRGDPPPVFYLYMAKYGRLDLILETFKQTGADPGVIDFCEIAAVFGHANILREFWRKGWELQDKRFTLFHHATKGGSLECLEFLESKGGFYKDPTHFYNVLMSDNTRSPLAAKWLHKKGTPFPADLDNLLDQTVKRNGSFNAIKYLIEEVGAELSFHVLMSALIRGDLHIFQYLVRFSATPALAQLVSLLDEKPQAKYSAKIISWCKSHLVNVK